MGTEGRNSISRPKPSTQMGLGEGRRVAKSHKHKETSAAAAPFLAPHWLNSIQCCNGQIQHTQDGFPLPHSQLHFWPQLMQPNGAPQLYPDLYHKRSPHAYSNAVGDSTLQVSEKVEDIPSEKKLDLMRQFKGSSETVGLYGDRSSRSEEEGTSYRNGPSKRVACADEASLDESDETNQNLKQRLNQRNADDYSMLEGSAGDRLDTALNLGISYSSAWPVPTTAKISDDSELRKQRRRQLNRESAKRSRLRRQQEYEKLQARKEALKAESSILSKKLQSVSEECGRLDEENRLIKEELVQIFGPGATYDLTAS